MFEIHTPKSWYSIFTYPSIIVDDDGLIYNSAEYHKLLRNPIGKFDYKSGYIYGEDYCKLMPSPIGRIKKDGTVTIIFGEDYATLNPTPILYIKGNEIYSPDEYNKLFSTPSAYIKKDCAKNGNTTNSTKNNNAGNFVNGTTSDDSFIRKILKTILIVFVVAFVGVAFIFGTLEDITYVPVFFIAIIVGFVVAFLVNKTIPNGNGFASVFADIFMNALCAEFASVVVFWIGILIIDLPGSHGFGVVIKSFLSLIMIAVMMAVPSIIIGLIVYGVRRLLKK